MRTYVRPKAATARRNAPSKIVSRSCSRNLGATSQGNASRSCCRVHARRGVRRNVHVQNVPAFVGEDDEAEQHATRDRGHREEITCDERADVVLNEAAPRLGRRPTSTGHQL